MLKIESILFWILIFLIVGIAVWMLVGSPTLEAGLVSIGLFVASSEILLWKFLFSIDKRTLVRFEKVRNKLDLVRNDISLMKCDINSVDLKINNINSNMLN